MGNAYRASHDSCSSSRKRCRIYSILYILAYNVRLHVHVHGNASFYAIEYIIFSRFQNYHPYSGNTRRCTNSMGPSSIVVLSYSSNFRRYFPSIRNYTVMGWTKFKQTKVMCCYAHSSYVPCTHKTQKKRTYLFSQPRSSYLAHHDTRVYKHIERDTDGRETIARRRPQNENHSL